MTHNLPNYWQIVVSDLPDSLIFHAEDRTPVEGILIRTYDGGQTWELALRSIGRWGPPITADIHTEPRGN